MPIDCHISVRYVPIAWCILPRQQRVVRGELLLHCTSGIHGCVRVCVVGVRLERAWTVCNCSRQIIASALKDEGVPTNSIYPV